MTYANDPKDYESKLQRRKDAVNHIETDHVPVMMMSVTWPFGYEGVKVMDYIHDRPKLNSFGRAPLKEFYCDIYTGGMFSAPIEAYDFLKPEEPQYFVSDDGHTMQHHEISPMQPEEYGLMISDMKGYMENVILPRRYPILNRPYPENYNALKNAFPRVMDFMAGLMDLTEMQKKEFGVPGLFASFGYAPMDYMMDFLRGFKGTTMDMRRRPEEFKKGLEAITEYLIPLTYGPALKKGDTLLLPLHCPPFLSPNQYAEFYWPTFKRFVDIAMKKKLNVMLGLEGNWTPHLETLKEFPKNRILGTLEQTTDIFQAKKNVGEYITLIGGMPLAFMNGSSKNECIDLTKRLIDGCAPGGGYLFCTDLMLMSKHDLNADNFKACIETVLTYK